MRSRSALLIGGVVGLLLLGGCDSNSLENPDHVRTWATTGSALAVFSRVNEPLAFAIGTGTFSDPMCPGRTDDGETATITGGCAAADGSRWTGTATVTRGENGRHTLVLDGYGSYSDPDFRSATDGTATVVPQGEMTYAFDVDIASDGLVTTRITYAGTVEGDYGAPTTWNGSGRVTRDGLGEPTGTVRVATIDERKDDGVCSNQPASGQTIIEAEGDRAVVTYDGAIDCDDDKAATWSFNGRDRGRITGIDCAAAGAGGPRMPRVVSCSMAALGLALVARARRRG